MIKHRKRNHVERTIEEVMQGVNDVEENQKKIMKILKKLKAYKITIQTLSAVQNALFPDNPEEKKKQPSHVFAREMAKHIN
jgi:wyosine [tRNA(Phe)-imidazoG37] synthetase (radical SAM superfamily)